MKLHNRSSVLIFKFASIIAHYGYHLIVESMVDYSASFLLLHGHIAITN